jgi:type IV pilus assembly protein PilB
VTGVQTCALPISSPNVVEFRKLCVERGMKSLRQDGFEKVLAGKTTVEEVLAATESAP